MQIFKNKGIGIFKKMTNNKNKERIGHYICALVNILGQKNKLISFQAQSNEALNRFGNTYGRVKEFRKQISESNIYFNDIAKLCNDSPQIKKSVSSPMQILEEIKYLFNLTTRKN